MLQILKETVWGGGGLPETRAESSRGNRYNDLRQFVVDEKKRHCFHNFCAFSVLFVSLYIFDTCVTFFLPIALFISFSKLENGKPRKSALLLVS